MRPRAPGAGGNGEDGAAGFHPRLVAGGSARRRAERLGFARVRSRGERAASRLAVTLPDVLRSGVERVVEWDQHDRSCPPHTLTECFAADWTAGFSAATFTGAPGQSPGRSGPASHRSSRRSTGWCSPGGQRSPTTSTGRAASSWLPPRAAMWPPAANRYADRRVVLPASPQAKDGSWPRSAAVDLRRWAVLVIHVCPPFTETLALLSLASTIRWRCCSRRSRGHGCRRGTRIAGESLLLSS